MRGAGGNSTTVRRHLQSWDPGCWTCSIRKAELVWRGSASHRFQTNRQEHQESGQGIQKMLKDFRQIRKRSNAGDLNTRRIAPDENEGKPAELSRTIGEMK